MMNNFAAVLKVPIQGRFSEMRSHGPNAPQKPTSAFMYFLRHQCSQSNDLDSLSFNEKRSYASKIWQSMSREQKQVYYDKVRAEQKAYDVKLAEYKKTDEYKQWLVKHENSRTARGKGGKSTKDTNGDADSIDDEFSSKFRRIEIFTPEFLDYNKQREMQLRNLRKEVCI